MPREMLGKQPLAEKDDREWAYASLPWSRRTPSMAESTMLQSERSPGHGCLDPDCGIQKSKANIDDREKAEPSFFDVIKQADLNPG